MKLGPQKPEVKKGWQLCQQLLLSYTLYTMAHYIYLCQKVVSEGLR